MKSILIIGLGRFGTYMAKKFTELGNHVMVLDTDEEKVNEILPYVTSAQIGDATKTAVLDGLGIDNFDLCAVCMGENFQGSLEATSLLKEGGAKYVLSRASTEIQAKFLMRNGADEVIFPEKQTAERLAVRYSANNVFDYIQLTPEYAIYEIPTPPSWAGKTIRDKGVRAKYNVNILGTKRAGTLVPNPPPDYVFAASERIIVMCRKDDIEKLTH